ncbi:arylsulfatase [Flexithrix dorotheae]|uniref:arylsulfatase n=1 Tax=Flexithrix dorotheae TaxID=70993 RepID=UPI000369A069|nr:arylsulfatase [Flexithrix dorotheae]
MNLKKLTGQAIAFETAFILVLIILSPLICASQAPNIVLIITDDQGYGDLSCHGNPVIKTPNIDELYTQSVRFTNFHVDPTCAPSRAALMTGKYAHRVGVWHTVLGGNHLRVSEPTMAEIFKENGYRTGLFGKWHLGANYPYRPMDRGFDEWLGQGDGGTGTTDDWFDNDRVNDYYWHNGERVYREGFAPDVFFDAAIDFIEKDDDEPFFVYLSTYLPHHPHTVPDTTLIEQYPKSITDYVSYFFAGLNRIDQNIGKLRNALEKSGKASNTIFIFMSDNGGTAGVKLFNAGMRGHKGQVYEGGHRVPFFIHWPSGELAQGMDVEALTAHFDVLPTLIDLCGVSNKTDFDGRSFKPQLFNPDKELNERILFVENQRTLQSIAWHQTAGMFKSWRLIDNKELYDLSNDPGQNNNIIDHHPDIVNKLRLAHQKYWTHVTPNDRERPQPTVGNPADPETFLTTSEWYLPKGLWNHAQVAKGSPFVGSWDISIYESGIYRFELRRWPREANAPIQGIPVFNKKIDSWTMDGGVDQLIYGNEMKALPVESIKLEVGKYAQVKKVSGNDTHITFDVELEKGEGSVSGTMLNKKEEVLSGAYYIYVTRQN